MFNLLFYELKIKGVRLRKDISVFFVLLALVWVSTMLVFTVRILKQNMTKISVYVQTV